MARPIKITPIINGQDAKNFRKELLRTITKKISREEKEVLIKDRKEKEKNYNLMVSISDGDFC